MDPKNYSRLAVVIFAVIALLQLVRGFWHGRSHCRIPCGHDGVAWPERIAEVGDYDGRPL